MAVTVAIGDASDAGATAELATGVATGVAIGAASGADAGAEIATGVAMGTAWAGAGEGGDAVKFIFEFCLITRKKVIPGEQRESARKL